MYLGCYELFQTLHSHSSPQDSSDSGEARVVPGEWGENESKAYIRAWEEEKDK